MKIYGEVAEAQKRYNPAPCIGCSVRLCPPAMEAGASHRAGTLAEIVALLGQELTRS